MPTATSLRTVTATRYVTPLREGGSLPGLVEADDDGLYVVKFRGAGQGPGALVAEVIVGELARGVGLPVPELVLVELDPALGAAEPDPEIQELLCASPGLNVGVDFLPGVAAVHRRRGFDPDPDQAAATVWLDALTINVDRTAPQPEPAPLAPAAVADRPRRGALPPAPGTRPRGRLLRGRFPRSPITSCCPARASIAAAHERLAPMAAAGLLARVAELVPDEWMTLAPRSTYADYLGRRLRDGGFAAEAEKCPPCPIGRSPTRSCAWSRTSTGASRFNAAVVLFCRQREFLALRHAIDPVRLAALAGEVAAGARGRARGRAGDAGAGGRRRRGRLGRSRRCRSRSASGGWWLRRAR